MHFSTFVVTTTPEHLAEVRRDLEALPGVEVRLANPGSGRLVLIHEGKTLESQEDALRRIQAHQRVLVAGLFYHYHDPEFDADGSEDVVSEVTRRDTP